MSNKWKQPKPVDEIEQTFPGNVIGKYLPEKDEIPEEFWQRSNKWCELQSRWFFTGLVGATFVFKDGIEKDAALSHLKTCQRSWEPKHEHKEAGAAYLMSLWLDDIILPESKP